MQVTLGNTVGAGFLGCIAAAMLYGITVVQAYWYYTHYRCDWLFQKVTVAILLLVDTVHMGMTIHTVYYYVIEQFGNLFALEQVVWSFKVQVLFNSIIVLTVQTLYSLRVWKLGSRFSKVLPTILTIILAGGYALGILLVVRTYSLAAWSDLSQPNVESVVKATFSCITGIDNILAISMCYYLHKSKSSFSSTNHRIVAVIHYVLVSGALTSAASLVVLVTFITMPNNLIFIGITFFLAKLYINSYIAMLNARQPKREESYSAGRIMHLHSASGEVDEPASKETVQISAFGARVAIREASASDSKRSKMSIEGGVQPGEVINIKVHRTEERIVDNSKGYWSPV